MRTTPPHRIAALVMAGISLAGCQSIRPQFSTSFANSEISGNDHTPLLTASLAVPVVEPTISETGETRLVMTPNASLRSTAPDEAPIAEGLPATIRPRILDPESPLQCVPFARQNSGIEIRGNANRWWHLAKGKYHRANRPREGSVLVMRGYHTSRRGHVAVVSKVIDQRTIVVDHANWGNDGRIYLQAPIRDMSAKNDWSRVQVWYTPKNQWGKRVYKAKGFIYPTTAVAAVPPDQALGLIGGQP